MVAPVTRAWLKQISIYFPKRLLLSFLLVLAFPKAWRRRKAGGLTGPRSPGALEKLSLCHQFYRGGQTQQHIRYTGHGEHRQNLQGHPSSPHAEPGHPGGPTSMTGLEASTFSSMLESHRQPPTVVKYLMAYLADAVFPAPDSPLMMRDWFFPNLPDRDVSWGHANRTSLHRQTRVLSPLPPQGRSHVTLSPHHLLVCLLCQSKDVGIHVPNFVAAVGVNHLLLIDGQWLVGVDSDEDDTWRKSAVQRAGGGGGGCTCPRVLQGRDIGWGAEGVHGAHRSRCRWH